MVNVELMKKKQKRSKIQIKDIVTENKSIHRFKSLHSKYVACAEKNTVNNDVKKANADYICEIQMNDQ